MVDVGRRAHQLHLELLLSHLPPEPLIGIQVDPTADEGLRYWDGQRHWQLQGAGTSRYHRRRLQDEPPPTDN